jgi:hypothetical protein
MSHDCADHMVDLRNTRRRMLTRGVIVHVSRQRPPVQACWTTSSRRGLLLTVVIVALTILASSLHVDRHAEQRLDATVESRVWSEEAATPVPAPVAEPVRSDQATQHRGATASGHPTPIPDAPMIITADPSVPADTR